MTGFISFISDAHVQESVLGSMAVTALIAALPKPGTRLTWGSIYKFVYDWLVGFWSMKTGHEINPTEPNSSNEVK